ncbi:MAG: hypothetical protein J6334_05090 [Kiritimatiellae bacterium]|nr:hypothetical protein [Kiritimatiellia bacterium]
MFERLRSLFLPDAERFDRPFYRTLQAGLRRMAPETVRVLRGEIVSAQTADGLFRGRSGGGDLYYTLFALTAARLFRAAIDRAACRRAIEAVPFDTLDVVHAAATIRIRRLLHLPIPNGWFDRLPALPSAAFPQGDPDAPYARFLLATLFRDFGRRLPPADLAGYRTQDGGFTNVKGSVKPVAAATTAALYLLTPDERRQPANALRALQSPEGGFRALPDAPQGDLLSTATAAFALHRHGFTPRYPTRPFLRACFRETGLFAATPDDPGGDLEYTLYGLLLMGMTP